MGIKLAQITCNLNIGRLIKYVMDNRCYSRDLMASRYGHFVYCGWINSYPPCNCFNCGSVKQKWGDLTDDDVTKVQGQSEKLVGILQEKYGYSKDKAQAEYNQFMEDNK